MNESDAAAGKNEKTAAAADFDDMYDIEKGVATAAGGEGNAAAAAAAGEGAASGWEDAAAGTEKDAATGTFGCLPWL